MKKATVTVTTTAKPAKKPCKLNLFKKTPPAPPAPTPKEIMMTELSKNFWAGLGMAGATALVTLVTSATKGICKGVSNIMVANAQSQLEAEAKAKRRAQFDDEE